MAHDYEQERYINEFDPKDYYETYYNPKSGALVGEWTTFVLKNLHGIFSTGNIVGDTLIDFGAGPSILNLLSACEVFKNIITSDFLEQNRAQLNRWLKKEPGAFDWTPAVKFVCELEGNSDNCEKKEEKVRKAVKRVLQCDALKNNPYEPIVLEPADCLLSCLCLEVPCVNAAAYCNTLKNFMDLLKPGGHIIIQSVLNCTFYYIGNKRFSCLAMTKEEIETAFREAGYEIKKMDVVPREDRSRMDLADYDSLYCVYARKPATV
ncbi:nicotinamide N-methyltransferase-like [Pelobates cultripes]|uniref:Nicotinamide N-methyltransferase-like n=1 Tax=Pelobates cultripes TaxID=61616 RepID=A0AAD1T9V2_PELCU|nr:nicotinamide N-methyltransferase-like [Pelobates cultripes]